jgi:hypothetical protein
MITHTSSLTLERMRLSVLWHQNLMDPAPSSRPEVLDRTEYLSLFGAGEKGWRGARVLPWPPYNRQGFWQKYLRQPKSLGSVVGRDAWAELVPLRIAAPIRLRASGADARVSTEGFLHPWGVTFVVTLDLIGTWVDFEAAAERLHELRTSQCFSLDGAPAGTAVNLESASEAGLGRVAEMVGRPDGGQSWPAFSVFTLISAEGSQEEFDPTAEPAGRFLQATSSFSPTWKEDALRPLAEAQVAGVRDAPPSHLIYGIERARSIWSPGRFLATAKTPPERGLGCHHRNLVLASMQTEALGRFSTWTADRVAGGPPLSGAHETQAVQAVRFLKKLYIGRKDSTYRSGSVQAQVDQNEWAAPINAMQPVLDTETIP